MPALLTVPTSTCHPAASYAASIDHQLVSYTCVPHTGSYMRLNVHSAVVIDGEHAGCGSVSHAWCAQHRQYVSTIQVIE